MDLQRYPEMLEAKDIVEKVGNKLLSVSIVTGEEIKEFEKVGLEINYK